MTEWRSEDRACPVCRGRRRKVVGRRGGSAHWNREGVETTVVRCKDCSALYQRPTLIPVTNPYTDTPESYFANHAREQGFRGGVALATKAAEILGRRGTLLDIGCGRGDLLLGAREAGWNVHGVEMTPAFADVAEASGIPVTRGTVEQVAIPTCDVVIFSGVLEHLYSPVFALTAAYDALTPRGLVFAHVPNEGSLLLRAGNAYKGLKGWSVNLSPTFPPFHVVGFTPKSLRHALTQAGFGTLELTINRWRPCCRSGSKVEHYGSAFASWLGNKIGMGEGLDAWGQKHQK